MKNKKTLCKLFSTITLTITSIHFFNKALSFFATKNEKLFNKNGKFYNHSAGKIFYTKTGSGSPVLLIHNLDSTSSDYEWSQIISHLSQKHTVYTLDLLGCGRSDKPVITYTSFLFVQLLKDFIKDIIAEQTDVIATGDSTSILVMTSKMYPSIFHHMILVNPTDLTEANCFPTNLDCYTKQIYETPVLGTFLYYLQVSKTNISRKFENNSFIKTPKTKLSYLTRCHEAAHLQGSSGKFLFASKKFHYLGCNIANAYKDLKNPICVILGEYIEYNSDITDWSLFLNPNTEVAIMEDTKYLPQLEDPATFVDICETFFENNSID